MKILNNNTLAVDINAAKIIKDFALPDMNFNKRVGSTLSNGDHFQ